MPEAATEKVADFAEAIVWLTGCEVMAGATLAALTVSVALVLVALPVELLTSTENSAPLLAAVSAGVA